MDVAAPVAPPPLWPHQRGMIDFAVDRRRCMWDAWMRTGKTRSAIEVGAAEKNRLTLVLGPKIVGPVWRAQVARYAPEPTRVLLAHEGPVARRAEELRRALERPDGRPTLAFVNYDSCWRPGLSALLAGTPWDRVICDESQRIKSPTGRAGKFVREVTLAVPRRLAMTGTVMPHSPLDAWGQYGFVDRSVLGWSFVAFKNRHCEMGGKKIRVCGRCKRRADYCRCPSPMIQERSVEIVGWKNLDELAARIAPHTYKVPREVLDLTPSTRQRLVVELGPEAKRAYRDLRRDMLASVRSGTITSKNAAVLVLRLQQITGGAAPIDEGATTRTETIDTAKQDALAEWIEGLGGEPCVVVCRFRHDLDAVHRAAAKTSTDDADGDPRAPGAAAAARSLELSGRRNELEAWREGGAQVLAVQIQSGGIGIDLTRARYMMCYSVGYSLGDYQQAMERVHGPDQKRPVGYYELVARGTIDGRIYSMLNEKKDVIDGVLKLLKNGDPDDDGTDDLDASPF